MNMFSILYWRCTASVLGLVSGCLGSVFQFSIGDALSGTMNKKEVEDLMFQFSIGDAGDVRQLGRGVKTGGFQFSIGDAYS